MKALYDIGKVSAVGLFLLTITACEDRRDANEETPQVVSEELSDGTIETTVAEPMTLRDGSIVLMQYTHTLISPQGVVTSYVMFGEARWPIQTNAALLRLDPRMTNYPSFDWMLSNQVSSITTMYSSGLTNPLVRMPIGDGNVVSNMVGSSNSGCDDQGSVGYSALDGCLYYQRSTNLFLEKAYLYFTNGGAIFLPSTWSNDLIDQAFAESE